MVTMYVGRRSRGEVYVYVKTQDESGTTVTDLPHLALHSPTGFEWGYGGAGPADLAYNILRHATNNPLLARAAYQDFKFEVVANLPHDGFVISQEDVHGWLKSWMKDPGSNEKIERAIIARSLQNAPAGKEDDEEA